VPYRVSFRVIPLLSPPSVVASLLSLLFFPPPSP
jgi:hypothetical protein